MTVLIIIIVIFIILFGATVFFGAPYVPSRAADLDKAFLKLYPISKKDTLIDLGSGGGKVLRAASRRGAKVIGVELNPLLALISKILTPEATIVCKSFYHYSFPPEATVVYTFADSRDIEKIYKKVKKEAKRLGKPLFLISLAFDIPKIKPVKKHGAYYLYKVS